MPVAHAFYGIMNQSRLQAAMNTFDAMSPPPKLWSFLQPVTSFPSPWWISEARGGFALQPLGFHAPSPLGTFSGSGGEADLVGGSYWPVGTVFEIISSHNHFPSAQQSNIGSPGVQIRDAILLLRFPGREQEAQRQIATCWTSPSQLVPE